MAQVALPPPPYSQGFRSKDPKPRSADLPPPGVETLDGINFDPEFRKGAPMIFKGPCMFSTTKGNVVVITGNSYEDDRGEKDKDPGAVPCAIPMIIADKMAKKLYDPDPPHFQRSHKFLKLKPVKVRLTHIEPLTVNSDMVVDKWIEAVYCAPLEFKFKELWMRYTTGKHEDPEVRAALVLGLKALREFGYPDMSEADLFLKLCPEDEKVDLVEMAQLTASPKLRKEKLATGKLPPVIPPEFQSS